MNFNINLNSKSVLALRDLIYWGGGAVSRFLHLKTPLAVLCYHSISSDGWRFSNTPEDFKKHIGFLLQHYSLVSLDAVASHLSGEKRLHQPSVAITFDDGYEDLISLVPYFMSLGIKPAVFALSDPENADRTELGNRKPLLTPHQLKALARAGWTIGCHSATHPDFFSLSQRQLKAEIATSKQKLENLIGRKIKYFAYPKGRYDAQIRELVKKSGYTMAFSMDNNIPIPEKIDVFAVPRIGIDASHSPVRFQDTLTPINIYLRRSIWRFSPKYEIS